MEAVREAWSPSPLVARSPVVVNGVMYFSMARRDDTLIPFDLESEKWKEVIQGPYEPWDCGR